MKKAEEYADLIIRDDMENFVSEKTLVYTSAKIERTYEFADGAVVKYEWQSLPEENAAGQFNHRFTLIKPPSPNPGKFRKGVVKIINY